MTVDIVLLLSALATVLAHLIDKTVTRNASAWDCAVLGILFQMALLFPFFGYWDYPGLLAIAIRLGLGVMTGLARVLWYKALGATQLSRVAPFRRFSTVFTAYFTSKIGQFLVVSPALLRPRRVDGIWTLGASQTLQMVSAILFLMVLSKQPLALSEPVAACTLTDRPIDFAAGSAGWPGREVAGVARVV